MPDTYTTNYNLTKPEPNASRDTWGVKQNANMDILDQALKALSDSVANKAQKEHNHDDRYLRSVPFYDGNDNKAETHPVGAYLLVQSSINSIPRNQTGTVFFGLGIYGYRLDNRGLGALSGIWANRGTCGAPNGEFAYLMQRVS